MSLLDFFTGRSADELVQYEPTSEDTITFGLRHHSRLEVLRMSNGFYFGMGGVPSVYDEYPDEQPILIDGYELDLDTLTAGGELVTIEEFTEAANDAGLDKDIMEDCLEELRVLWQEREEEEAA